jgi:chemotaxis methyl-accepting protein methylase
VVQASLDRIIEIAHAAGGRDLSAFDRGFLAKTVEKRLVATSSAAKSAYIDLLSNDNDEVAALVAALHVSYSEFFRDPLAFAVLEQIVLPGLAGDLAGTAHKEIRVWSTACAAGEEAWSVAMLLEDLASARDLPTPYRIFATDIDEAELERARGAVYDEDALHNVRMGHLARYFTRLGRSFTVGEPLRRRVDVSAFDLLDEGSGCVPASIFGDFDLVLCCNVLFYYREDVRRTMLARIGACLTPGGYLVTGEAERTIVQRAGGFATTVGPAAVFRKVG